MVLLQIAAFLVGVYIVQATLRSAVRTVVVPRGEQTRITRTTFLAMRAVYDLLGRRQRTAEGREEVLARYGPVTLLTLAAIWALGAVLGFILLFWAAGVHDLFECVYLSGSSVTTLGFRVPSGPFESVLAVAEGLLGLAIVALLISYLPTIYQLFSRREAQVAKLDVRAGSPPTALEMLIRFHRIEWTKNMDETWAGWEDWFSELEESHTSLPVLVYFRSQRRFSSWITGAGAVLDAAALSLSTLDLPWSPEAAVTIRAGTLALRAIARFYGVPINEDPAPNDPISIYREEFFLLCDDLAAQGLPLKADREQAWRDFAGWRVNYDESLLALCALIDAPPTPWSSDRIQRFHRPTLLHPHWHIEPSDMPASW